MKWFGEPWPSDDRRAPVCEDDADRVDPPPPGELCVFCNQGFKPDAQGVKMPHMARPSPRELVTYVWRYCHLECLLGNIWGTHQFRSLK